MYLIMMIIFILLSTAAFFAGRFYTLWYEAQPHDAQVISQISDPVPTIKTITGQIDYIEGNVEVRDGVHAGWFAAAKSGLLTKGKEMRTLSRSRAIVTFEDGSIVRLDENTHIVLEENVDDVKIAVLQGEIFNSVTKDDVRAYVVQTAHYAITALGTEFGVTETAESTSVIVLESAINVQNENGVSIDQIEEGNMAKIVDDRVEKSTVKDADRADEFIAWSTVDKIVLNDGDQSAEIHEIKEKKDETEKITGTVVLSGEKSSSGVRLRWDTKGVSAPYGFKVIKSTDENPVYPGDDYQYLDDPSVREYKWKIDTGEKYHFRVCVYNGDGKCLSYSNDIQLDTPSGESGDGDDSDNDYASAVTLSAKESDGSVKLTWEISGGDAPMGFKIVKSKEANPVYPGDDYQYLSDKDVRKYTWDGFSKGKTYHFRVCVYKGGTCGTYSNDVKVSF